MDLLNNRFDSTRCIVLTDYQLGLLADIYSLLKKIGVEEPVKSLVLDTALTDYKCKLDEFLFNSDSDIFCTRGIA